MAIKEIEIEITRAIFIAGEPVAVGEKVTVSESLAIELISYNKAIRTDAKAQKIKTSSAGG